MFIVNIDTWYSLAWAVWEVFVVCFCWLFPLLSCLFALKNIIIPVTQNRCTSKVKQRVLLKLFYSTESSSMIWLSTFMDCNFKLSLVCILSSTHYGREGESFAYIPKSPLSDLMPASAMYMYLSSEVIVQINWNHSLIPLLSLCQYYSQTDKDYSNNHTPSGGDWYYHSPLSKCCCRRAGYWFTPGHIVSHC